jgi:HEAT repeat protein
MSWTVLLATAPGEDLLADHVAAPLRAAGYTAWHQPTVLAGDALVPEAVQALSGGGPVVLCGTVTAMGTRFARRLVQASRAVNRSVRVFPLLMSEDIDVDDALFSPPAIDYWRGPDTAMRDLLAVLTLHFPLTLLPDAATGSGWDPIRAAYLADVERRYRRLELAALTPEELDEHTPILLRQVFVPQHVRADPPPVELPKDLLRRLAATGQLAPGDVPDALDMARLERAREDYQHRPTAPVLDVVTSLSHRRTVILGDPGSGKSTLARYLALTLAAPPAAAPPAVPDAPLAVLDGWLPLLVELRDYAAYRAECPSFLDFWDRLAVSDEGPGLPRTELERFLADDGRALVVFDGLDEIFDRQIRETVTRQIIGFAARFPKIRLLVTSRITGFSRRLHEILDGAGFTVHTLQDLDQDQIRTFAAQWFTAALPGVPDEARHRLDRLMHAVETTPSVRDLAGNPLLLTVLAIIARRRELPRERRRVYEHAANVLVEQWDPSRHLPPAVLPVDYLTDIDRRQMLRRIAARMQNGPHGLAGNHIHHDDLVAEISSYLTGRYQLDLPRADQAARAMVDQFRERNFVLSLYGPGVYGFVHRAFLEYFCADEIVHRFEKTQDLDEAGLTAIFDARSRDDAWQEVLLLTIATIDERFAEPIISRLARRDTGRFWGLPELTLAARCLTELTNPSAATDAGRAILETLAGALDSEYQGPDEDRPIVRALSSLGTRWPGRDAFRDWYLIRGRHLYDEPRGVNNFWTLRPGRNAAPRGRTYGLTATYAAALVLNDDPAVRAAVRSLATDNPNADVRRDAVESIAECWPNDPDRLWFLLDRLVAEDSVSSSAVELMAKGFSGDQRARSFLHEQALHNPDTGKRRTALQAIGVGWPTHPDTLPLLYDRATHDEGYVRLGALQTIATHLPTDTDTLALMRDRATHDEAEGVRELAVQTIATRWPTHADTPPLMRDLATGDEAATVRHAALRTIIDHWPGDPMTLPLLLDRAAQDDSSGIRLSAVRAIGGAWDAGLHVGPAPHPFGSNWPTHPGALDRSWSSDFSSDQVRDRSLSNWHARPGVLPLVRDRAVHDPSAEVRREALRVLVVRWPEDEGTLPLLLDRAGRDESAGVRMDALRAFGGERKADRGDWWDGYCVPDRIASRWREHSDALPLFRSHAADDAAPEVRRQAVETLGAWWREDLGTVPLLLDRARHDEAAEVRLTAVRAIAAGWLSEDTETLLLLLSPLAHPDGEPFRSRAALSNPPDWADDLEPLDLPDGGAAGDPSSRRAAMTLITTTLYGQPDTLALLTDLAVHDNDADIRARAVDAIARYWPDDPATLPLLQDRAIHDEHRDVRAAAAEAIVSGWPDRTDTLDLLRRLATDDGEKTTDSAGPTSAGGGSGTP